MSAISSISGSALQAYGISLQVTAQNIAKMNTENRTAATTTFQENPDGGVTAKVSARQDTVDISREAINLMMEDEGVATNITVMKADDEMAKELLGIN